MRNKKENKIITETIKFLVSGKFSERKPYLKDFYGKGVEMHGYIFSKEGWNWVVAKPTDIDSGCKGEPLVKVIPTLTEIKKIPIVLNTQSWTYI